MTTPVVLPDHYLRKVALSLNCPSMWIDDCVQEMRIALWLNGGVYPKLTARRRGIDFLRKLSHQTRNIEGRKPVQQPVPFTVLQSALDATEIGRDLLDMISPEAPDLCVDEWLDLATALDTLSPREADYLGRYADGASMAKVALALGVSESWVCHVVRRAREKLREACA